MATENDTVQISMKPIQKTALDYYYNEINTAFNGKMPSEQANAEDYPALYAVTTRLVPVVDGKLDYGLLIWRLAYLLRHLEASSDIDKATKAEKRLKICFFVNYLLEVTGVKLEDCKFPSSKNTANDLFKKAFNLAHRKREEDYRNYVPEINQPYMGWVINFSPQPKRYMHPILPSLLLVGLAVLVAGAIVGGAGLLGVITVLCFPGSLCLLYGVGLLLINKLQGDRFQHIKNQKEMLANHEKHAEFSDTPDLKQSQCFYSKERQALEPNRRKETSAWKNFSASVKVGLSSAFFSKTNTPPALNNLPESMQQAYQSFKSGN